MLNCLLKTFSNFLLIKIFIKSSQNKILITLIIISFFSFSSILLAQNEIVNNSNNETQNEQTSLADRIESDLPEDIKINNDIKKPSTDGISKNNSPYLEQLSSLMFNDEEQTSINIALEAFINGAIFSPQGENKDEINENENIANKRAYLYLASIMYVNNQYWAVWINDQKITSEDNLKNNEIYIKSIQKDEISVVWTIGLSKWKVLMGVKSEEKLSEVNNKNQVVKKFKLKPNQTYLLLYETIIEGSAQNNISIISKSLNSNNPTITNSNTPTIPKEDITNKPR